MKTVENSQELHALPSENAIDLQALTNDAKRMLRVQWKEFVHFIEDCEFEQSLRRLPSQNGGEWRTAA